MHWYQRHNCNKNAFDAKMYFGNAYILLCKMFSTQLLLCINILLIFFYIIYGKCNENFKLNYLI